MIGFKIALLGGKCALTKSATFIATAGERESPPSAVISVAIFSPVVATQVVPYFLLQLLASITLLAHRPYSC